MKKIALLSALLFCCSIANAIEVLPQKSTYYQGGHIKTWMLDKFALNFVLETVDTPNIKDAYIVLPHRDPRRPPKHIAVHGQNFYAVDGFKLKSAIYTDGDLFTLFLKERPNQPTQAFISMISPNGHQFFGLDFEIDDTFENLKVQEMGWSSGVRIIGKKPKSDGKSTMIEFKKGQLEFK